MYQKRRQAAKRVASAYSLRRFSATSAIWLFMPRSKIRTLKRRERKERPQTKAGADTAFEHTTAPDTRGYAPRPEIVPINLPDLFHGCQFLSSLWRICDAGQGEDASRR